MFTLRLSTTVLAAVGDGSYPRLFAGEEAVLMLGRFSRTAPAGLAGF